MQANTELPRVTDLDRYYYEFFLSGKPVVVEGAARRMTAFDRWTDEYLLEHIGDTRPNVRFADGRMGRMAMADFLRYLAAPDDFQSSLGPVYLTDFYVLPSFLDRGRAALALDASCPLPRGGHYVEWISLYAGPPGTSSPMHQDIFSTHTWLAQLRGLKMWRLCAPPSLDSLRGPAVDAFGTEELGCAVYGATLSPGDVIYLPPNWWHQVRNESSTLAISGNFCGFDAARTALAESEASDESPMKDVWVRTWTEILLQEAEIKKQQELA